MKNKIMIGVIGFVLVLIAGIISHFVFEWSSEFRPIAVLFPVNESVFEHLKLLFFPYLIWSIAQYFIDEDKNGNFIAAHIYAVLIGILFIIVTFYTYSGIIGESFVFIDILIFVLSVALTFITAHYLTYRVLPFNEQKKVIAIVLFFLVLIAFVVFTYSPIKIDFFKDELSGEYGIK